MVPRSRSGRSRAARSSGASVARRSNASARRTRIRLRASRSPSSWSACSLSADRRRVEKRLDRRPDRAELGAHVEEVGRDVSDELRQPFECLRAGGRQLEDRARCEGCERGSARCGAEDGVLRRRPAGNDDRSQVSLQQQAIGHVLLQEVHRLVVVGPARVADHLVEERQAVERIAVGLRGVIDTRDTGRRAVRNEAVVVGQDPQIASRRRESRPGLARAGLADEENAAVFGAHRGRVNDLDPLRPQPAVEHQPKRRGHLEVGDLRGRLDPVDRLVPFDVENHERVGAPLEDALEALVEESADRAVLPVVVGVPRRVGHVGAGGRAFPAQTTSELSSRARRCEVCERARQRIHQGGAGEAQLERRSCDAIAAHLDASCSIGRSLPRVSQLIEERRAPFARCLDSQRR